jgi:hypothetical protein
LKEPKLDDNPWRGFFIVSASGADLVVCLAAGYFAGRYLGGKFGHEMAWMIGGILAGLVAGVAGVITLIRKFREGGNG